ncbi:MAG: cobalamin-dependent protein [Halanaerobiales bacterium]
MPDFGSRLRKLRKEFNLRQKDLAADLGLAQTTIANYEKNARFPNQKILTQIADYFEVSLDYLVGRSQRRFLPDPFKMVEEDEDTTLNLSPAAETYLKSLLEGDKEKALKISKKIARKENGIEKLYFEIFEPSLKGIGKLWEENIIGVEEEHYFSNVTREIMNRMQEFFPVNNKNDKTVIGLAAAGEMHEIGIKMVMDFFEFYGWNTYYLGINTPNRSIVNAIKHNRPEIIAISATMPNNINNVKSTIRVIKSTQEVRDTKIIVGGSAFKHGDKIWKTVGADGVSFDPRQAVEMAEKLSV